MIEGKLGRDVFLALAAVGWADGNLDAEEADAIVRTAVEEGLDLPEIEAIERATRARIELQHIDLAGLTKADRLFVYAVGAWMTRLDGKRDDAERLALDALGAALKIPERPREHADAIVTEILAEPNEEGVVQFDLPRLRRTIAERLAEAQRLRAEG